jgi:hypothetical protein
MNETKHTPTLEIVLLRKDKYKVEGEAITDGERAICEMIPGESCAISLTETERLQYANLFIAAPDMAAEIERLRVVNAELVIQLKAALVMLEKVERLGIAEATIGLPVTVGAEPARIPICDEYDLAEIEAAITRRVYADMVPGLAWRTKKK